MFLEDIKLQLSCSVLPTTSSLKWQWCSCVMARSIHILSEWSNVELASHLHGIEDLCILVCLLMCSWKSTFGGTVHTTKRAVYSIQYAHDSFEFVLIFYWIYPNSPEWRSLPGTSEAIMKSMGNINGHLTRTGHNKTRNLLVITCKYR